MALTKNVGGNERLWRIAAGTGLVALGLLRRGGWRLSTVAGAGLLASAWSGYCPLNEALGIDSTTKAEPTLAATGKPIVEESSEDSFPASDAPSWTAGR